MKRFYMLMLIFVLTAALMTGCGCTGPTMDQTEAPTILPTNEEVRPTTHPTTQPTTEATTQATTESTSATQPFDNGNGPMDSVTGTDMTEAAGAGQVRMR